LFDIETLRIKQEEDPRRDGTPIRDITLDRSENDMREERRVVGNTINLTTYYRNESYDLGSVDDDLKCRPTVRTLEVSIWAGTGVVRGDKSSKPLLAYNTASASFVSKTQREARIREESARSVKRNLHWLDVDKTRHHRVAYLPVMRSPL
jgi:hypothetical protein